MANKLAGWGRALPPTSTKCKNLENRPDFFSFAALLIQIGIGGLCLSRGKDIKKDIMAKAACVCVVIIV